ncbi:hypothetical protein Za10_1888 (plasmid) [Zymomonas mobilis subsp. mobilis NCIMB 11163]|nr:hypothetical protein Za10_1888 [Zymomonas mobilis subsp. mobilis NCIMB 11163]
MLFSKVGFFLVLFALHPQEFLSSRSHCRIFSIFVVSDEACLVIISIYTKKILLKQTYLFQAFRKTLG